MVHVHVIRPKVLVEGISIRAVAREMGVSRNTVRKYLQESEDLPPTVGSDFSKAVIHRSEINGSSRPN